MDKAFWVSFSVWRDTCCFSERRDLYIICQRRHYFLTWHDVGLKLCSSPLIRVTNTWWIRTNKGGIVTLPPENQKSPICVALCLFPHWLFSQQETWQIQQQRRFKLWLTYCTACSLQWQPGTLVHGCCRMTQRAPHWIRAVCFGKWQRVYLFSALHDLAACRLNVISDRSLHLFSWLSVIALSVVNFEVILQELNSICVCFQLRWTFKVFLNIHWLCLEIPNGNWLGLWKQNKFSSVSVIQ